MVEDCGDTEIETSVAAATVRVADPLIEPEAAVIVVVPALTPEANPWVPAVLLIVATLVFDELQVTEVVIG